MNEELAFFSNAVYYTEDEVQETQQCSTLCLECEWMITNGSTKIMSTHIAKCFLFGRVLLLLEIKITVLPSEKQLSDTVRVKRLWLSSL